MLGMIGWIWNVYTTAIVGIVLVFGVHCLPDTSNLRQLMQNYPENQELIASLGTQYEIVYPVQYRHDWVRGLSTREISSDSEVTHVHKTSVVIETLKHKFHLDLDLNVDLLAPTVFQTLQFADHHKVIDKDIENCYYHATVRNYNNSYAALRTCFGISGVIYLEKELFLIHPLYGEASINHPHVLYRYFDDADRRFSCGNEESDEIFHCLQDEKVQFENRKDELRGKRYIELALFLDKSFFEKFGTSGKDPIVEAIQIVNSVDLLLRALNTSLSIVYLEIWAENQIEMDLTISKSLDEFQKYVEQKLVRFSVDAAHLLTGFSFLDNKTGMALTDSICTMNAVGLTKVDSIFKTHKSSLSVSHMIGHNLGMYHDHQCCLCASKEECLMSSDIQSLRMFSFSVCSIEDYARTMRKGYGECLRNMPRMRESICGNGIIEKEEECDCGSTDMCLKYGSCCDPITCKYIKHAECSTGACCNKCKLLSMDHMCRPSKGECDIPEFCDAMNGECPEDLHKKNGAICEGGLSYCYKGTCPSVKQQCQGLWGEGADVSHVVCLERLNVQGTPNGNCGPDGKGGLVKCSLDDSRCGILQCQQGMKAPTSTQKPLEFIVNKININGKVHECKVIPSLATNKRERYGLIEDGTKCGYQKFCLNASCIKIRSLGSGDCPTSGIEHLVCSGRGICTNKNTCFCDEGWVDDDCSKTEKEIETEDMLNNLINHPILSKDENDVSKQNFQKTLMISIIGISVLIGLILVLAIFLALCRSKTSEKASNENYSSSD